MPLNFSDMRARAHTHAHISHTHAVSSTHTGSFSYTLTNTHTHTHTHNHTDTYIHTHTHTHTHTPFHILNTFPHVSPLCSGICVCVCVYVHVCVDWSIFRFSCGRIFQMWPKKIYECDTCDVLHSTSEFVAKEWYTEVGGPVCCSVLQCVAVCCIVLQCVAVRDLHSISEFVARNGCNTQQYTATLTVTPCSTL